jgi:hypothetical protein
MTMTLTEIQNYVVGAMFRRYGKGQKTTLTYVRTLGEEVGIDDMNFMYELVEMSWVIWYRQMIEELKGFKSVKEIVSKVWDFYDNIQPSYTAKDSTKAVFQQYSTSAPISLLAGWFCDKTEPSIEELPNDLGKMSYRNRYSVFEASAGNGLLTIWNETGECWVNELSPRRLNNLKFQHYAHTTNFDASKRYDTEGVQFDAILTNPPFGTAKKQNWTINGYAIDDLDAVMACLALGRMKDDGRAAIIIGEHTIFNYKGEVVGDSKYGRHDMSDTKRGSRQIFFDWLHHHYNVLDSINIDSRELYGKQGTIYPLNVILISERKERPFGRTPEQTAISQYSEVVGDIWQLYDRVARARERATIGGFETYETTMNQELSKLKIENKV